MCLILHVASIAPNQAASAVAQCGQELICWLTRLGSLTLHDFRADMVASAQTVQRRRLVFGDSSRIWNNTHVT
jgi:hypothetical protein